MGYDLESGRLRDIAAKILGKKPTQIANAMSINNNLIPELRELLEKQEISFSTAVEIAGLEEDEQEEIYRWYPDKIITVKKIREYKQRILEEQQEAELKETRQEAEADETEEEEETEIEGQMEEERDFPKYCPTEHRFEFAIKAFAEKIREDIGNTAVNSLSELREYFIARFEGTTSEGALVDLRFSGWWEVKNDRVKISDPYDNVIVDMTLTMAANVTYQILRSEEQKEETERVEIPQMNKVEVPGSKSDERRHRLKLAKMFFDAVDTGKKSFELRKNDRNYQIGDVLELHEMSDGEETGRVTEKQVIYILEGFKGLEEGYCILGLSEVEDI